MILRIATLALAGILAWAVLNAGTPAVDLGAQVRDSPLARTGTAQPVTAVLLGFRAYDTLLEVAVLLLAALAGGGAPPRRGAPPRDPLLHAMTKLLVPLMALIAGYLLWAGTRQAGGAFQAGAVLAAAGVLLLLAGAASPPDPRRPAVRVALAAGLALFLVVFVGKALASLLLLVESVLALSIAFALVSLFASARR